MKEKSHKTITAIASLNLRDPDVLLKKAIKSGVYLLIADLILIIHTLTFS